jgi:predicted RNA methylase
MAEKQKNGSTTSLRFRRAKNRMQKLGQVATPDAIAKLLANQISPASQRIVDLGSGRGALTTAVLKQCPDARALLLDIDRSVLREAVVALHPRAEGLVLDAMRSPLVSTLQIEGLLPDVVVSNPPYAMVRLGQRSVERVQTVFPSVHDEGGWLRSDVVFAAHSWSLLSRGATMALIVASPLATHARYRAVRQQLVSGMSGLTVTQLDSKTFGIAEVDAFLITGQRAVSRRRGVLLRQSSIGGEITGERRVSFEQALERFDFNYHNAIAELNVRRHHSVGNLDVVGAAVVRGSRSRNEFNGLGYEAFHTSDFASFADGLRLTGARMEFKNAERGDILIARVGSRCLTREAFVAAGAGLFTDCVYRIRVPEENRGRVWNTLTSDFGREWRQAHAVGNCAKHITVGTLLSMPVLI